MSSSSSTANNNAGKEASNPVATTTETNTEMPPEEMDKQINEEYKIWKKNTPFLYDCLIVSALEWPSLTVDFFPDKKDSPKNDFTEHRLLLGTHTSDAEKNHLLIAEVKLPKWDTGVDSRKYDDIRSEVGGFGGVSGQNIKITQKIEHEGEVNRARYMPQNPTIIATKTVSGDVHIFDYTKHESNSTAGPNLRLKGHEQEGYGLSWSKLTEGELLSCADDGIICRWSVASGQSQTLNAGAKYLAHEGVVEDVAWHEHHPFVFASVGDDKRLMTWDTRKANKPSAKIMAHTKEVNCISFNPYNEFTFATGSADKVNI